VARGLRLFLNSPYAVVPVVILAAVLRAFTLDSQPLSGDEAMLLHPLGFAEILRFDLMFNPPLFRLLVQGALGLSPTVVAARLIPLCAGTGTVWLLYLLANRLLACRTTALTASLLLALHPWHILHSQSVRAFALMTFLTLLARIMRPTAKSTTRKGSSGGAGRTMRGGRYLLVHSLALLTHYLSLFAILTDVGLLWKSGRRHLAVALLAVPLIIGLTLAAWLAGGVAEKTARGSIGDHTAGFAYVLDLARCSYAPGGLALAASLLLTLRGFLSPALRPCAMHAAAWIAGTTLLGFLIPIEVRYALPILPLLLLALSHGATQLLRSTAGLKRAVTAAAFLVSAAGIIFLLPAYYHGATAPERTTRLHRDLVHAHFRMDREVEFLAARASPEVPIVLAAEGPLHYRLLLELAGGSVYPRSARLTGTGNLVELAVDDFRVIKAPGPQATLGGHFGPPNDAADSGFFLVEERHTTTRAPAGCLLFDNGGHIVIRRCPSAGTSLNQ
jgi:hypothetical protein